MPPEYTHERALPPAENTVNPFDRWARSRLDPGPMIAWRTPTPDEHYMQLGVSDERFVRIYGDGRVRFSDGITPDEGACVFWDAVIRVGQHFGFTFPPAVPGVPS